MLLALVGLSTLSIIGRTLAGLPFFAGLGFGPFPATSNWSRSAPPSPLPVSCRFASAPAVISPSSSSR
ncbi:MAG: hypothetical protein R3D02_16240 [Hyphomicrobiales bacterium]